METWEEMDEWDRKIQQKAIPYGMLFNRYQSLTHANMFMSICGPITLDEINRLVLKDAKEKEDGSACAPHVR